MMMAVLVTPKGAYHYMMHLPDLISHFVIHHHHHQDASHNDHHQHKDLPFNHDHSGDHQYRQSLVLYYQPPLVMVVTPVAFSYAIKDHSPSHPSGFIRKVWLPPKIG